METNEEILLIESVFGNAKKVLEVFSRLPEILKKHILKVPDGCTPNKKGVMMKLGFNKEPDFLKEVGKIDDLYDPEFGSKKDKYIVYVSGKYSVLGGLKVRSSNQGEFTPMLKNGKTGKPVRVKGGLAAPYKNGYIFGAISAKDSNEDEAVLFISYYLSGIINHENMHDWNWAIDDNPYLQWNIFNAIISEIK